MNFIGKGYDAAFAFYKFLGSAYINDTYADVSVCPRKSGQNVDVDQYNVFRWKH